MNITGNTIFIPGATSGIGLALAQRLKARGNTVIIGGRRTQLLDELREQGFDTVRIDTADPQSITDAAAWVIAEHPELNVLVTMAGVMLPEDWHTPEGFLQTAEDTVSVNLLGPIRLIGAFIGQLQSQPGSTIITVSSGLASVPLARTATYSATKAAIHSLSERSAYSWPTPRCRSSNSSRRRFARDSATPAATRAQSRSTASPTT